MMNLVLQMMDFILKHDEFSECNRPGAHADEISDVRGRPWWQIPKSLGHAAGDLYEKEDSSIGNEDSSMILR